MPPAWILRIALLLLLFGVVALSRLLLGNRAAYRRVLENRTLALLHVALYNACCYLAVGIPADLDLARSLSIRLPAAAVPALIGSLPLCAGIGLFVATLLRRRVIGAQDTPAGLITTGTYRFARHPIYLGIVLVALSLSLLSGGLDGLIIFPLVFLANYLQAAIEERYDVGARFAAEYGAYRATTWMFGPPWFWVAVAAVLVGVQACS